MSDDLNQRGGQDRARINVNEEWELRDWAEKLGVTQEVLRRAVAVVGDHADKVKAFLFGG